MNIGILSRNSALYSTRRLAEAAALRGHSVRVVDYLRCYMDITSKRPAVLLGGHPLRFDAVIPRIGASHTFYGSAVVRQFEIMGVFAANTSQAIVRSRDKLVTGYAHATKDIDGLLDIVGGAPLVIKLLEGTQGMGVVLAPSRKAAESVIGAFRQLDANILVQEFIAEAGGADVRVFVIDGEAVAAMKRQASSDEFRSNLHRGGTATVVELTDAERHAAVRAAEIMGLGVAGVDLLQSDRGPLVLEVNSSPGLEGIESATGIDVADKIITALEHHEGEARKRWRP